MKAMIKGFCIFLIFLVTTNLAFASASLKEKNLGTYGSWKAYSYNEGGQRVCYMVTTKTLTSQGPSKRAMPYLMITHRPTEASTDVISYGAGTIVNSKKGIKIGVGKMSFDLFSVRDTAWARDSQIDHKLAKALQNMTTAIVTGYPDKKGLKPISDKFDLSGSALAYRSIGKACGLPVDMVLKNAPQKTHLSPSQSGAR